MPELERPTDVYDRVVEWDDLSRFAARGGPGLAVGVVYGRRRQGKSYLLRRLAAATGGFYYQALEEEPAPALERLASTLGGWLDVPGGRLAFEDWSAAVSAIADLGRGRDRPVVVVLDEFPYLLDRVPELASLLQRVVDASRDQSAGSVRLVLCGSALSVMTELLSGQRALRGRVATTVAIEPFDFRNAAAYWGLADNWEVAVRLHAILGGTPGYRDLLGLDPPRRVADLGRWLAAGVCNPASAMFREDDYLLAEQRGLTDRALYHSVLSAVAMGNHTETKMAAVLGRERQALSWPLKVLVDAGFVTRDEDALRERRPTYRIAEPIVRFHHVVTRADLARFEERRAAEAWADAAERFSSHVLGPHFEDLARQWTARYASAGTTGGALARVGATQVNDPAGRSHYELDVVGVGRQGQVSLIGEAKFRSQRPGAEALSRLDRLRELLASRARLAPIVKLAVFSGTGFSPALVREAADRADVELIDLERLYAGE